MSDSPKGRDYWRRMVILGLLNNVAIVTILVGGPPVLIINWNPLLKLDGYYILMDLLEAPNLMDNSKRYLGYLIKSRLLRVPSEPVHPAPRLRKAYVAYSLANFAFVAPLTIYMPVIIYYIFEGMLGEALALPIAVVMAYRMLVRPARKSLETLRYAWLSHRPHLSGASRGSVRLALMGTGAVVALVAALVGPRFAVRVDGVGRLEPLERVEVRAAWPGFVQWEESSGIPDEGTLVRRGDLARASRQPGGGSAATGRRDRSVVAETRPLQDAGRGRPGVGGDQAGR